MGQNGFIAVGGENLVDHITRDGEGTAKLGGSPVNVALALGRQGASVRYVSPVSKDRWGDAMAAWLAEAGVTLAAERVAAPTTMARVTLTDGIPSYLFERDGTAERAISEATLRHALQGGAQALHTGSLAIIDGPDGALWERQMAQAFDEGRLVSLDPNVRLMVIQDMQAYRARLMRMITKVHVLKLSDEDLEALYPSVSEADAMATLRSESSALLVALTRGAQGAQAWLGDHMVDLPAPEVPNLVDTVGAGDTFMASLLAGLAEAGFLAPEHLTKMTAAELEALIRRAGVAAALNCGREGCDPPDRATLMAALAS